MHCISGSLTVRTVNKWNNGKCVVENGFVLWITAPVAARLQSVFLIEAKLRKKDENLHFFFLMRARITVRNHVQSLAERAGLPTAWGNLSPVCPDEGHVAVQIQWKLAKSCIYKTNNLLYFGPQLCVIVFHNCRCLSCTRDNMFTRPFPQRLRIRATQESGSRFWAQPLSHISAQLIQREIPQPRAALSPAGTGLNKPEEDAQRTEINKEDCFCLFVFLAFLFCSFFH